MKTKSHSNNSAGFRRLFFNKPTKLLVSAIGLGLFFSAALMLSSSAPAKAAACTPPTTTFGTDTMNINVATAGTYNVWVRMQAPATTSNQIMLQVDTGGSATCFNVGGLSSMPLNTWTWVDYQNGSTSSLNQVTLTAGAHTLELIGTETGVSVDRIELLSPTDSCTPPVGTGDNCTLTTYPGTPPSVSISAPAANSTVSGTSALTSVVSGGTTGSSSSYAVGPPQNPAKVSGGTTNASVADTTTNVGDLLVLTADYGSNAGTISNVSGGNVTTWQRAIQKQSTGFGGDEEIWYGIVSSAGSSNIAISWSSATSTTSSEEYSMQEFSAGSGQSWRVDGTPQINDNSGTGTTVSFPSLTPSVNGDLYFGFVGVFNTATAGTSAGFAYNVTQNSNLDAWNTNVTAAVAPTATQSPGGGYGALGVLFTSSSTSTTTVTYKVDGTTVGSSTTAPNYSFSWNSASVSDGSHSLVATVSNASGTANSPAETITTANNANACTAAPQAPTGLSTSGVTASNITVNWSAPAAVTNCTIAGYNVYRSTSQTGTYTKLNASPVNALTYPDTTVSSGTAYFYEVTTVFQSTTNASGTESAKSASTTATTSQNCTSGGGAPSAPTLSQNASTTSYTQNGLTWTPSTVSAGCSLSSYNVYRVSSGSGGSTAISAVGSPILNVSANTAPASYQFSISPEPQNVGDLIVLAARIGESGPSITSITEPGVTWTKAKAFNGSTATPSEFGEVEIWYGAITATGSPTVTVNWQGTATGHTEEYDVQEFSGGTGQAWSIDGTPQAKTDSTATISYPSLTPSGSGELYFGASGVNNNGTVGSTAGFNYIVTTNANLDVYSTNAPSPSAPTAPQSGGTGDANIGVLFSRGSSSGTTRTLIKSVAAGTTSYIDTGSDLAAGNLAQNTSYSYQVDAVDSGGNKTSSSVVAMTTLKDNVAPTVPTISTTSPPTATTSSVTINWNATTDLPNPGAVGVAGYNVYVYANGGTLPVSPSNSSLITGLTDTITGLTANKTYNFIVTAVDNNGNQDNPASINPTQVTTLAPTCSTAPSAPTITGTQNGNSITLNWGAVTPAAGCTLQGYQIFRNSSALPTLVAAGTNTFTDSGLAPGGYSYNVETIDSNGPASVPSNSLSFTVADTTPPTPVTSFTSVAQSPTQVLLSWSGATDNVGVSSFVITRANGGSTTTLPTQAGTASSYVDSSVAASTSYTYSIKAVDAAGNQSSVVNASVTTPAPSGQIPPTPTGLQSILVTSNFVAISWNASSGATSYTIVRTGPGSQTTQFTSTATQFGDSNLANNTSYTYTVAAVNSAGSSSPSGGLTVQTLTSSTTTLIGDINADGKVNIFDLAILLSNWSKTNMTYQQGDLNADGTVNIFDLGLMLGDWTG